jgi:cold shock CspA family protein
MEMATMTGTITTFAGPRGYGFITCDGDPDQAAVFLHVTELPDHAVPAIGTRVEFEIVDVGRGPRAINVVLLEAE